MHIFCKKIKEDILALTYSLLFRHSDRPDNYEIPVSSDIEVRLSTFSQLQQGSFYSVSCCFYTERIGWIFAKILQAMSAATGMGEAWGTSPADIFTGL